MFILKMNYYIKNKKQRQMQMQIIKKITEGNKIQPLPSPTS